MSINRPLFPKIRALFSVFKKGRGDLPLPPLVVPFIISNISEKVANIHKKLTIDLPSITKESTKMFIYQHLNTNQLTALNYGFHLSMKYTLFYKFISNAVLNSALMLLNWTPGGSRRGPLLCITFF